MTDPERASPRQADCVATEQATTTERTLRLAWRLSRSAARTTIGAHRRFWRLWRSLDGAHLSANPRGTDLRDQVLMAAESQYRVPVRSRFRTAVVMAVIADEAAQLPAAQRAALLHLQNHHSLDEASADLFIDRARLAGLARQGLLRLAAAREAVADLNGNTSY